MPGVSTPLTHRAFPNGVSHHRRDKTVERKGRKGIRKMAAKVGNRLRDWLMRLSEMDS